MGVLSQNWLTTHWRWVTGPTAAVAWAAQIVAAMTWERWRLNSWQWNKTLNADTCLQWMLKTVCLPDEDSCSVFLDLPRFCVFPEASRWFHRLVSCIVLEFRQFFVSQFWRFHEDRRIRRTAPANKRTAQLLTAIATFTQEQEWKVIEHVCM